MGLTKTDLYTDEQIKIAAAAKVIGHPARVAILQQLLLKQACICGELVMEIGLSQATISQHLRELKDFGIIKGNVDGTKVCYCINFEVYHEMKTIFENLFNIGNNDDPTGCC